MGRIGLPELIILAVIALFIFRVIVPAFRRGYGLVVVAIFIGAVIGFLLRPSLPLIGQLPFDVVLTRGANLQGVDLLAKSTAETSFNYIVVGALIGLVAGIPISRMRRSSSTPPPPAPVSESAESVASPPTDSPRFCSNCGTSLIPGSKFCNSCGTKVS